MTSRSKAVLGMAAAAALLSGCATDPYYDRYAYNDGYYSPGYYYERPAYSYYNAPAYYYPRYYSGPSVAFGLSYHTRRYR
jgi:hypothetical protein